MFDKIKINTSGFITTISGIILAICTFSICKTYNIPYDYFVYKSKIKLDIITNNVVCSKTPLRDTIIDNTKYFIIQDKYALYNNSVKDTIINDIKYYKYKF